MSDKVIVHRRGRFMAGFMLLFAAVFGVVPFLIMKNPFEYFMFYAWYGFLILWSLFWGYTLIRNPLFSILIRDGELIWQDDLNKQTSGRANLARVKCLLLERTVHGSDPTFNRTAAYLVMEDDRRLEISPNAMCSPEKLLREMRSVNPRILRRDETARS